MDEREPVNTRVYVKQHQTALQNFPAYDTFLMKGSLQYENCGLLFATSWASSRRVPLEQLQLKGNNIYVRPAACSIPALKHSTRAKSRLIQAHPL